MIFLLIKKSSSNYRLLSPDTYGIDSWGTHNQLSIKKKTKHWYSQEWIAGSIYGFDRSIEIKLKVVVESKDILDIMRYLKNKKVSELLIDKVLEDYKNIMLTYYEWLKYLFGGD